MEFCEADPTKTKDDYLRAEVCELFQPLGVIFNPGRNVSEFSRNLLTGLKTASATKAMIAAEDHMDDIDDGDERFPPDMPRKMSLRQRRNEDREAEQIVDQIFRKRERPLPAHHDRVIR
jgi:hypothetical protein